MPRITLSALLTLAIALCYLPVGAEEAPTQDQDNPPTKSFSLLRDDDTDAEMTKNAAPEPLWIPSLQRHDIDVVLSIGYMSLGTTIFQHDQIIYKYNADATFWGDVEMTGQSAFAPTLRLGYQLTNGLAFEGWSGISLSEYTSSITNRRMRLNTPDALPTDNPPLGEFDAEQRSLITIQAGINALVYPLDFNDPSGRWHPFITGGAGNMWYSMNSNYVESAASTVDLNFGGGVRFLADKNISLRFDVVMHRNTVEWTPAEYFLKLNQDTTLIPLNEYPQQPDGSTIEQPVQSFSSNTINLLQWSLGFHGSF